MTLKTKLLAVVTALLPAVALAAPGDLLVTIPVANPSPMGVGVGVAVDCSDPPTMYYTNCFQTQLHSMTTAGVHINSIPMFDAATSNPISFGDITWDEATKTLWGGTDNSGIPIRVYQIDPVTGACTFKFTMAAPGCCGFCDGIAMDRDRTLWVCDDVADDIEHWDISGVPFLIETITPDSAGITIGMISGLAVGKGDRLYLGQDGLGTIIVVTKAGSFISDFAVTGGRVSGLACDPTTFAPKEALWGKDAYGDFVQAFEVESGTCGCAGAVVCGDVDGSGSVNVVDITYLVDYLFFSGPEPVCDGP